MATVSVISKTLETEYYLPRNKENTFVDNGPQMCCKLGLPPLLTKSQNKKKKTKGKSEGIEAVIQ